MCRDRLEGYDADVGAVTKEGLVLL
jgi:hypothetical protein